MSSTFLNIFETNKNFFKKTLKNFKKGIDKWKTMCYDVRAMNEAGRNGGTGRRPGLKIPWD